MKRYVNNYSKSIISLGIFDSIQKLYLFFVIALKSVETSDIGRMVERSYSLIIITSIG